MRTAQSDDTVRQSVTDDLPLSINLSDVAVHVDRAGAIPARIVGRDRDLVLRICTGFDTTPRILAWPETRLSGCGGVVTGYPDRSVAREGSLWHSHDEVTSYLLCVLFGIGHEACHDLVAIDDGFGTAATDNEKRHSESRCEYESSLAHRLLLRSFVGALHQLNIITGNFKYKLAYF